MEIARSAIKPRIVKLDSKPIDTSSIKNIKIEDAIERIREKNKHFTVSYHPHIGKYAIKLDEPKFHRESENFRELMLEAAIAVG